jgi:alpha-tubulin suppressor-like RCC1 family protein
MGMMFVASPVVMLRAILIIFLWFASIGFARADLSFVFNSSADIAVAAPGYSASGPLNLTLNFPPVPGQNLTVVKNTGTSFISGTFNGFPQGATVPLTFNGVTYHYIANYYGGNGRSLLLQWPAMGIAGWGSNSSGVLGDIGSTSQTALYNIPLAGLLAGKTIIDISGSGGHVLALTSDGRVFAWGSNGSGQLGNNSTTNSPLPVAVDTSGALSGQTVVAIAAGENHSFAITSDGRLFTWGKRRAGFGQTVNSVTPVELNSGGLVGKTVVAISPGGSVDIALTSEGEMYGWGDSSYGQLGTSNTYSVDPIRIGSGEIGAMPVIAIAAGSRHSLALSQDGRVFSWGSAQYGALGIDSPQGSFSVNQPVAVNTQGVLAGKTITSISSREGSSMVVASDGRVYAWGRNWNGELGDGTTTERSLPVAVDSSGALAAQNVAEIRFGSTHSLALTTDGKIFSWGDNGFGQLGSGTWHDSLIPVAVASQGVMKDRITARMATGWQSSLALIGLGVPTITRHPLDLMAAVGQTATFTAEAEDPFSFSIQWQVSPNGPAGPFTDIAGNTNTLSIPDITAAQDGYAYRAVFISAAGQSTSTPAVLRIVDWSATLSPTSFVPFKSERVRASGTFLLSLESAPITGKNITLIENTGPEFISGSFDNLPQAGLINLTHNGIIYPFVVNYYGGNGRSLVLQWPWTAVAGWGSTIATSPENIAPRPALATKTITALKAGSSHQIVLSADGKVFGWGSNNQGQLGNTLTTASTIPVSLKDDAALAGKMIAAIASATNHNLALTTTGEVFSWGNNTSGKLGDGSTTNRTQPVAVVASGALAGKTISAIAAGDEHSLALTAEGKVFAWGSNSFDQLGTEAWQDSSVPVAVDTRGALRGKTITAIAAGYRHSLVLTSDGEVISWGSNGNGQLGNGTNIDPGSPIKVDVSGALAGKRVIAIAAAEDHSLALTEDGLVFAWGDNAYGQLGDNSGSSNSLVPVPVFTNGVLAGKIVAGISAGIDHCLAITKDGITVSWGRNLSGQLGNGGTVNSPVPVLVASNGILSGAAIHSITAFGDRSFALLGVAGSPFITTVPQSRSFLLGAGAGSVSTSFDAAALDPLPITLQWQEAGPSGDFSNITGNPSANSPTLQITELTSAMNGRRYRAVFSNVGGTAITTSATLNVTNAESPVELQNARENPFAMESATLVGSLNVSLGFAPVPGDRLILVNNTGSAHLTGRFANLTQGAVVPLEFGGRTHSFIVDYYGGNGRSLVLHWASALAAGWGDSSAGQVGSGTYSSLNRTPLAVTSDGVMAGETLVKLVAGTSHSLALAASGRIFAWGDNASGRLGNSSITPSSVPVRVTATGLLSGKTVVNIAAGGSHSLALTSDGQVAAWGSNSSGQLGTGGSSSGSAAPVAVFRSGVLADKLVTDIAAGQSHSVALLSDGTMVAWGANSSGQLGTGNTTQSTLPVAVLSNGALAGIRFVAIAAGANHTLALSSDGRVFSWGSNQSGQLGRGSSNSSTPVAITGGGMLGGQPVIAIAAGASHSLALAANGRVFAWGLGSSGQLGIGNTSPYFSPTAVSTSGVLSGKSIVAIAAGANHSLAIDSNGSGYAWGSNSSGQLGNNSFSSSASSPVSLSTQGAIGSRALTSIAAGGSHSLAIAGRGTAPTVSQAPTSFTVTAGNTVTFTAAGNGYPAPTVRWQRSTTGPTGTFTDLAGQTTNTLQLSNVSISQSGHAFRAVFSNMEANANSTAAVLTVQPTLATYLTSRGLPANSPPLDDPFQTGVPHLLAYAFDVNPAAPDRTKLPAVTVVGGRLRISYVRWKNAADLQYTVEACNDLSDWQSGPGITETVSVTPIDNSRETVVEQELLPAFGTRRFMRVRITLTAP